MYDVVESFQRQQEELALKITLKLGDLLTRTGNEPNYNVTILGDIGMRLGYYDIALKHGILTLDEVRSLEELPPLKDDEK